jgi:hypothetical protein
MEGARVNALHKTAGSAVPAGTAAVSAKPPYRTRHGFGGSRHPAVLVWGGEYGITRKEQ